MKKMLLHISKLALAGTLANSALVAGSQESQYETPIEASARLGVAEFLNATPGNRPMDHMLAEKYTDKRKGKE
jgi:hypothetical protein